MQRTVMIFGAGLNQVSLIKTAAKLGIQTVVIDPISDSPGSSIATYFYQVSRDDYHLTKEIAIKHNVDGIITGQMENPLQLMAKLANEMGYIFHSPCVVVKSTNKYFMKQAFVDARVPCARGKLIKEGRILSSAELSEFGYPLIVKPPKSFSSRGVFRIDSYDQYLQTLSETLLFSEDQDYLVEEYVDGKEYSVEAITYNGKTEIIQYTEKFTVNGIRNVELGHIQPASLSPSQKASIDRVVTNALRALGIDNSASHTELKVSAAGPIVIEVGARMGGGFITSHLVPISTGFSIEASALQIACGCKPEVILEQRNYAMIRFLTLEPRSAVQSIEDYSELMSYEDVCDASIYVRIGSIIPDLTDNGKRSGHIIVKGESRSDVLQKSQHYIEKLAEKVILQRIH